MCPRCDAAERVVDEFPVTVTGKIQKFKMREPAIAELGLDEVRTA